MTHFKNNIKKLEKLRGIFFQIGLIVAGGLTLIAFEWMSPVHIAEINFDREIEEEIWDMVPIIPIEEKVDKPKVMEKADPKPNPDIIEIVKDDKKEVEKKEKKKELEFDPGEFEVKEKVVEKDIPVVIAGIMPHFKECADMEKEREACTQQMMFAHFKKSTKVPEVVKMKGKAVYKAFVYFEVNKKGKVVNVKVMDDKKNELPRELQRQAYDAVQTLPEFNPGKNNHKKVSVKYVVPFKFTVN